MTVSNCPEHLSRRVAVRFSGEEERIHPLQPYIQFIPQGESILGNSKPTQKLAKQIALAAANTKPVIFQAQSGTGKTFLAKQIHTHSELASYSFAELNCAELSHCEEGRLDTDILFGRVGKQAGILELLGQGTLLLDHVEVLGSSDRTRLLHYLRTGYILPNHGVMSPHQLSTEPPQPVQSQVRLILASPTKLELPELDVIEIKLFTLTQRKADIPEFAHYFLDKFCREKNRPSLQIDQVELRRLISYDYPGNLAELAEILHRAVSMTCLEQSVIPEQALWSVQSDKNAFRLDLLTHVPWLRQVLLSRWYPEGL